MTSSPLPASPRTEAIRRFNRFYTRRIGVLHENLVETPFTLTESRLLWEFAHRERTTAAELARDLHLDPGYLSRLLRGLKEKKLIRAERSGDDARHLHLSLTAAGQRAFAPLDRRSEADVAGLLAPLPDADQRELLDAMGRIERLLGERGASAGPGTCGRRATATSAGSSPGTVRSMPASTAGTCVSRRWWRASPPTSSIASTPSGKPAGWPSARATTSAASSSCRRATTPPAPSTKARPSFGCSWWSGRPGPRHRRAPGRRVRALRPRQGYRRIVLWTNSVLVAARSIYTRAGYVLTRSEPHQSFGQALVGENWELRLA
jgi:DNA-binding MarR family transcriptional regulator